MCSSGTCSHGSADLYSNRYHIEYKRARSVFEAAAIHVVPHEGTALRPNSHWRLTCSLCTRNGDCALSIADMPVTAAGWASAVPDVPTTTAEGGVGSLVRTLLGDDEPFGAEPRLHVQ